MTEFRLEWGAAEGSMQMCYSGPGLSYEMKGLFPATNYFCRVQVSISKPHLCLHFVYLSTSLKIGFCTHPDWLYPIYIYLGKTCFCDYSQKMLKWDILVIVSPQEQRQLGVATTDNIRSIDMKKQKDKPSIISWVSFGPLSLYTQSNDVCDVVTEQGYMELVLHLMLTLSLVAYY